MDKWFNLNARIESQKFRQLSFDMLSKEKKIREVQFEIDELKADAEIPPVVTSERDEVNKKYEQKVSEAHKRVKLLSLLVGILIYVSAYAPFTLLAYSDFWICGLICLISITLAILIKKMRTFCVIVAIATPIISMEVPADMHALSSQWIFTLLGVAVILNIIFPLIALCSPDIWYKMRHNAYEKDPEYQKEFDVATKQDEAAHAALCEEAKRQKEADRKHLPDLEKELTQLEAEFKFYAPLLALWECEVTEAKVRNIPDLPVLDNRIMEEIIQNIHFEAFPPYIENFPRILARNALEALEAKKRECDALITDIKNSLSDLLHPSPLTTNRPPP